MSAMNETLGSSVDSGEKLERAKKRSKKLKKLNADAKLYKEENVKLRIIINELKKRVAVAETDKKFFHNRSYRPW